MFFPVAGIVPAMLVAVPPAVVGIPAMFAFGVQVAAARFSLRAALTVFANCFIQSRFRLFNLMLALGMIVRIRRGRGDEHRSTQNRGGYG